MFQLRKGYPVDGSFDGIYYVYYAAVIQYIL